MTSFKKKNDPPQGGYKSSASLEALARRSMFMKTLRDFFYERDFLEIETPLLSREIIPELHIDPIAVPTGSLFSPGASPNAASESPGYSVRSTTTLWLQASPELYMKRLLATGAQAIFQVTRSFRAGELGALHNPEFTIVEWYRQDDDLLAGMDLLDSLLQVTLGTAPARRTTYAESFQRAFALCPHTCPDQALADTCLKNGVAIPDGMELSDRDEWLNLLLATRIEPALGRDRPEIVYHYPASQSSLAQVAPTKLGYDVAERFEVYYRGIELANGFHELTDADEQRRRFEQVNAARIALGRSDLPLPESLLTALDHGFPSCAGCALGFDRLVMLAMGSRSIDEVMAFSLHAE